MRIIITVPIPKTDQNKKTHYRVAAARRKKDVEAAKLAVDSFLATLGVEEQVALQLPWSSADIHVKWYHPTKRFRDIWNIVGALKGTVDGIVRSGILIDDDLIQPPTIERLKDKMDPRVELYLTKGVRKFS